MPFYNKIKSLKGSEAITKVGQMNLGAVFLETVCHLVNVGTTIVCIFPKAHLTERGEEAVAFRRMLLNLFGLHTIFNYPAEGLFDSVTEETCIFVGKVLQKTKEVLVYSSDVKVADIDLHALQSVTSGYCRKDFATVFPGVEARVFDWSELDTAVEDGWRMVCSEMSEAIDFANKSFWMNDKLIPLSDSTSNKKCGSTDRGGGTDLLYFETFETLANKYKSVPLDEGVREAKSDDFELYKGTNKFINFNNLSNSLSISIINDFIPLQRKSGKQQRTVKSVAEWNKIFRTKGRAQFPENSVLVPTKIRKSGRIHLARIPLHVSSNFTVFSYENAETAEIIASYMTTVFYQLDCEIQAKVHAGVRKQDMRDIIKTYVPKVDLITKEARNIIKNEIPNIVFLNLSQPQIRKIDKIWAEILFGSNSEKYVTEAQRLLRFLANRRNPQ